MDIAPILEEPGGQDVCPMFGGDASHQADFTPEMDLDLEISDLNPDMTDEQKIEITTLGTKMSLLQM